MENGFELSKTLSTLIFQKILMSDIGLNYICHTYQRFSHITLILVSILYTLFLFKWSKIVFLHF